MVVTSTADFTAEDLALGEVLFRAPCSFVKGVVRIDDLPKDGRPEVAFAGRSNVGKSSLINALLGEQRAVTDVLPATATIARYELQPAGIGSLVDALHAQGISAVAWYLPGHDRTGKDLRRARAMLSFRTPAGDTFDGVALDIESLRTKNVAQRTTRMVSLLGTLRDEAGSTPVAAITYPPRAFERHLSWWPGFPWTEIAQRVDAIVPMLYTGGGFKGYDATYGYVARSLRLLRAAVGSDIAVHAAGGVA